MSSYYSVFKDKQGNTLIPYQIKELKKQVSEIIESGQNYIKLSDGTMICYSSYSFNNQTLSDFYSFCNLTPDINVVFPKQFKGIPIISVLSKTFQMFSTLITSANDSSFKFRGCYPKTYSSMNGEIDYIAIGRWK